MDFVFDKHLSIYVIRQNLNHDETAALLKVSKPHYLRNNKRSFSISKFMIRHARLIIIIPSILLLFTILGSEPTIYSSSNPTIIKNNVTTQYYENVRRGSKMEQILNNITHFDSLPDFQGSMIVSEEHTNSKPLAPLATAVPPTQIASVSLEAAASSVPPAHAASPSAALSRPVVFSYVEEFDPFIENDLLDLFIKAWTNAGWDIKILSLEDAKKHNLFDEFSIILDKVNICCVPRQSYMRHLAMSTVKEGGFFSEQYVFPLRPDLHNEPIPNRGNFTSHDGIFGSLMSGNYNEWNRMTELLLKNIKMNVVLSLETIHKESATSYHHGTLVTGPYKLLSNEQFKINMCNEFNSFSFIRFHTGDMRSHGIDKEDRTGIASSLLNIYNAKCFTGRPVIFTFYEPVSYLKEEDPEDLLHIWKKFWSESGWEPVILNEFDAKRHPSYKPYSEILEKGQFKRDQDKYNYFCFIRWIAAAASGGGM